jgi:hypothetical protein
LAAGLVCGFLALPVLATYFALRVKNLLVAAVFTWAGLWIAALFALTAAELVRATGLASFTLLSFASNGAFALLAGVRLRHSLSRRLYAF